jgi:hypothetical protein
VASEDEKRWRAALERLRASNVKILLSRIDPLHPEQTVPSVGDREPWPTREFVASWLRDDEAAAQKEEARRYHWLLLWTIVAGGAGIVAAITGLIVALRG